MSGAAQEETILEDVGYQAAVTESASGLRQVASERLEAHRQRRADFGRKSLGSETETALQPKLAGTSRVRDAVAARYQNSVTYREFLAQQAELALEQAHAEAEVAARNARAVAEAQMQLLKEIEQWNQSEPIPREIAQAESKEGFQETLASAVPATELMEQRPLPGISTGGDAGEGYRRSPAQGHDVTPAAEVFSAGLTVRLYEDLSAARLPVESARRVSPRVEFEEHEDSALDAEIAFRRAPEFDQHQPLAVGISGNLIEFPRQLVAARKARPRLAEGPLREEAEAEPQLRIFEVEPEQISSAPAEVGGAPEWQGILLESGPASVNVPHVEEQFHFTLQPQTARAELRLMAATVDASCIGAALLGFAAVVAELAGPGLRLVPLPLLGVSAAAIACLLFVMYQVLFFTLGEATPGMRFARIGLCTFGDGNPTRSALRRRVLATLLAACPLGLGLAWAWMDEDSLGWHDRISRMYQRAY